MAHTVRVGELALGAGHPLFLIAGPCVVEDEETTLSIARFVRSLSRKLDLPFIFKSSYDKANRSSVKSYRGPGLERGLEILAMVKEELQIPILVDVHNTSQIPQAAAVADILQVPAFLCRQTDLVREVASAGLPVNIKKGQFLAPWELRNVIEKVEDAGNHGIMLTERGVSFGYNNLVVDFRSFPILAETGYPVVFDATHSVQLPGGKGDSTGGQREYIQVLARAAVAAGVDGLFLEVHPTPEDARSDSACMLPLAWLEDLLTQVLAIRRALVVG